MRRNITPGMPLLVTLDQQPDCAGQPRSRPERNQPRNLLLLRYFYCGTQIRAAVVALLEKGYDIAQRRRSDLLASMTPDLIRRWREESPPSAGRYQAGFLGCPPRSGTTLLE